MIFEYFQHFIDNRIIPKKCDIMTFLADHPLKDIAWTDLRNKIKVKLQNEKKRERNKERKHEESGKLMSKRRSLKKSCKILQI